MVDRATDGRGWRRGCLHPDRPGPISLHATAYRDAGRPDDCTRNSNGAGAAESARSYPLTSRVSVGTQPSRDSPYRASGQAARTFAHQGFGWQPTIRRKSCIQQDAGHRTRAPQCCHSPITPDPRKAGGPREAGAAKQTKWWYRSRRSVLSHRVRSYPDDSRRSDAPSAIRPPRTPDH
jgi:hypothetical protein